MPPSALIRLVPMFFAGSAIYLLKDRIRLSGRLAISACLILILSAINRDLFFLAYSICMPYLVFCFAYLPDGRIRSYNKLGDYSYGIYVYAFMIQQCVTASIPGVAVSTLVALSAAFTAVVAVLSWHCVEKPALAHKTTASIANRKHK